MGGLRKAPPREHIPPMEPDLDYPAIRDLAARAKRRIPHFVWEFLDSATGEETTKHRSAAALDRVILRTGVMRGDIKADLTTTFLGRNYAMPVGIAPVGMSGLMWPDAERRLSRTGAQLGLPYAMSCVSSRTPEHVADALGGQGWFQLYPTRDADIRRDILKRAKAAGFHTLILTADVPIASRRERQRRARLRNPPKLTLPIPWQAATRPVWALGTIRSGYPRLRLMEEYAENLAAELSSRGARNSTDHVGYLLRTAPDFDYLAETMDEWDGPVVVKGVLNGDEAAALRDAGAAAVWVSNHGGRQFDAAPASADALPEIRKAVGPDYPLIFDSGVRSGLDVLRAIALGADFVFLGRAWHYGLAALGRNGARHVAHILREDMVSCLGQMGLTGPVETRGRIFRPER